MAQSSIIKVKNLSGATILKGKAVYVSGHDANTGYPLISLASYDNLNKMPAIGLVDEDIANRSVGNVRTFGVLNGFDTSHYNVNTEVYVGLNGSLSYSVTPGIAQKIGVVSKADRGINGQIIIIPLEIEKKVEHHDLLGLNDDDHIQYIRADGSRRFVAPISGVDPQHNSHLTTKLYVDQRTAGAGVSDHGALTGLSDNDHPQYLLLTDIDDVSVNGITNAPISSNWAYDHENNSSIHYTAASLNLDGYRLESDDHTHQSTGLQGGQLDHGLAITGLSDDDHTQYALLVGRSGGQTLIGGTLTGNSLTVQSTSHGTKGKILFGTSGYDEVNNRLGIGTSSPSVSLEVLGAAKVYNISSRAAAGASTSEQFGSNADADSDGSTACGANSICSGTYSTALGASAYAASNYGTAVGNNATAGGLASETSAVALGYNTSATKWKSTALGSAASAAYTYSTAVGAGAATTSTYQVMLGMADQVVAAPNRLGVGGTTSPTHTLSLYSSAQYQGLSISNGTHIMARLIGMTANNGDGTLILSKDNVYKIYLGSDSGLPSYIDTGANFGIGTTTPTTFKLQVAGHTGPNASETYDLGTTAVRWKTLYLSDSVYATALTASKPVLTDVNKKLISGDIPWANVTKTGSNLNEITTRSHSVLSGLADDDHTQYALLAGRSGGQTLIGGTASGNNLTVQSTSNVTKGKILFGTSTYDEVNNYLGIGTTTPQRKLHIIGPDGALPSLPAGLGARDLMIFENNNNCNMTLLASNTSTASGLKFADQNDSQSGEVRYDHSLDQMTFWTARTQRLTINASGLTLPVNNTYDLGSSSYKWKDLYLQGNITVDGTVDGVDVSAHAADSTIHFTAASLNLSNYLLIANIDDVPVDGELSAPISSNWAYDHVVATDPHALYTLADGTRSFTGDVTIESSLLAIKRLTSSAGASSTLDLKRARGATGGELAVNDGDTLGRTRFYGLYSGTYQYAASVAAHVDGTIGPYVPAALTFNTATAADSLPIERMRISPAGVVKIAGLTASYLVGTDVNKNLVSIDPATIGGGSDHGALTGLADDDHLQYAPLNGTRSFTGDVNVASSLLSITRTIGTLGVPTGAAPTLDLKRARGTVGSELSVEVGDFLGRTRFYGLNSGTYRYAAAIGAVVDAALGTYVPGALTFGTATATDSTPIERMRISSDGYLLPAVDNTYSIGIVSSAWKHLFLKGQLVTVLNTTSTPTGTTQTIDFNDGNVQILSLGSASGDVTVTLGNGSAGASYIIKIVQGATPRDVVWPASVQWPGGIAPTITASASAVDVISLLFDGTNYYGNFEQKYS